MTQSLQPGSILDGESVKLLKAGDVLMLRGNPVQFLKRGRMARAAILCSGDPNYAPPEHFTFIGRPDADGWIAWTGGENPVPGCRVDVRFAPDNWCADMPSDNLRWEWRGSVAFDISAFRLATPSAESAVSEISGQLNTSPERVQETAEIEHDGEGAAARERLDIFAEGWPKDRFLESVAADLRIILSDYDRLSAEVERLRGALDRLASSEAFDVSQVIDGPLAEELRRRMDYAARARQGGPDNE